MRPNYTLARLYVPQTLSEGAALELPKTQAHYLATVLRKAAGDDVRLFNGEDGEWRAQIDEASKRAVTLTVRDQLQAPMRAPDIWLLFAPVKKQRNDFIIEKATELGASHIRPVVTARTQFPKLREDRMRVQAIEAAEQTERLDVPQVFAPVKLDKLLKSWEPSRRIIFADEAGDSLPALQALPAINGPAAILVGPEGGFDPKERERLRSKSYVTPVSLGPRILRADTAALSLLTLWQSVQGDWPQS